MLNSFHSSVFDKTVFCLREEQGVLVNYECSSWYSGVGNFLMSVWDGERKFYMAMAHQIMSVRTTPLQSARSMALIAMAVECDLFIYFILSFLFYLFLLCVSLSLCLPLSPSSLSLSPLSFHISLSLSVAHCLFRKNSPCILECWEEESHQTVQLH